jgi:hypothetical protein
VEGEGRAGATGQSSTDTRYRHERGIESKGRGRLWCGCGNEELEHRAEAGGRGGLDPEGGGGRVWWRR